MGDPNYHRFHYTQRGIGQTRYCFRLAQLIQVQAITPISLLLTPQKSLQGLPNWISLQEYVLVAGDTS